MIISFLNFERKSKSMNEFNRNLWTFLYLTYKKEERGEEVTYESFLNMLGKNLTDKFLKEAMHRNKPLILKEGNSYRVSSNFEAAVNKIRNLA